MVGQFPNSKPLSNDDRDAAVKPITDGLSDLIFGEPGLFEDRPGFIAGPPPGNPFSDTVQAITRANCRVWARANKEDFSPRVNAGNAALCKPYLEDIGEWPGDGELFIPFEGGQCEARYTGSYEVNVGNPPFDSVRTVTFTANGPVTGIRTIQVGPVAWETGLVCRGATQSTSGGVRNCSSNPGDPEPLGLKPVFFGARGRQMRMLSLTACGADNCGNPPPEYEPPGLPVSPPALPPNITVNPPGFPPVNVNIDLDPEGQPIICFEEFDVCVTVNPPPGEDPGGGDGGPDPETDPGSPGGGGDTGSGGDSDGQADEGEELVGVLIEVLSAPGNANVFDNNSETVYRGIGYVRMGYPGRMGLDVSGGVVRSPQFFHAQQRGLTRWEVFANVGFNLRVTPYYREIE